MTLRLAVIGDVHGFWNAFDNDYFNRGHYHGLLFAGDLAPLIGAVPTARRLADLRLPALVIPGNHDAVGALQFLAELRHRPRLADVLSFDQPLRLARLRRALGPVQLAGYSLHEFDWDGRRLGVIAARPYSMGGDRLYFRAQLKRQFGVADLDSSTRRLCALVDQAPADLLFLAHNGPAGLGSDREDPWGCDFVPGGGDFGDADLQQAIAYARQCGRRVHAVLAGHMHHRMKRGRGIRRDSVRSDGVLYVNAAEVPRIVRDGEERWHHHVALEFDADGLRGETVWVAENGQARRQPLAAGPAAAQ